MNRTSLAAAAAVLAVAGLGISTSAAEAKAGDVVKTGVCSKGSAWKLKAKPENGGTIGVEFEVDSNKVGQVWSVKVKDNALVIFSGSKTTVAPSGSFTVSKITKNQAGADVVTATASTVSTGETCSAKLTF